MMFTEKPDDFKSKFDIVSCFLEHDGKFLLLHRQDHKPQGNTWGAPAGKVEEGETAIQAILRELEEETGYAAHEDELSHHHTVFVRFPEFDFVYHIYHLPLSAPHKAIINPADHKACAWVTPEESLSLNLITAQDACIKLHYQLK